MTFASQNHLTNLSTVPQPISQTWEISIPIPPWITTFFHVERGLLIIFQVTISAHQFSEEYNTFTIEIIFRRAAGNLFPHPIKESRIILMYLWPNHYYQVDEEVIHAPIRVSLDTGVTSSEGSTYTPPSSNLHFVESPIQPNHSALESPVPSPIPQQQSELSTSSNIPRLINAELTVKQVLTHIRSGINLGKVAFTNRNITFCHLQQID